MQNSFISKSRSSSLPRLPATHTEKKLFFNQSSIAEARKLFMERLNPKQQQEYDNDDQKIKVRSFVQVPKTVTERGFVGFKEINLKEKQQIFEQMTKIRSRSTLIQPFIKAEILINKVNCSKINQINLARMTIQKDFLSKRIKHLTPPEMKKSIITKGKTKSKSRHLRHIQVSFNSKIYQQNFYSCKPYIDYHSMPVAIGESTFFIGGRKQGPIVVFNVRQSSWKEESLKRNIKCFGETDPCAFEGNKILCFGGYDYLQPGHSLMVNSLKIIDKTTLNVVIEQFDEQSVLARAFHSQCIYGRFLIVSGGIDKANKMLNTFVCYNFDNKTWNEISIFRRAERLMLGFAKHQSLAIFHKRDNYGINTNNPIVEIDEYIKVEGLYMFGGEDSVGDLMSSLYIVKFGRSTLSVNELNTVGVGPLESKNSRMIRHKQYLIIHGGRNDEIHPPIFCSLHFLSLKTLNWVQIESQNLPYRHSHALNVVDNQIIIMGGKNLDGLSKEVFVMPFKEIFDMF